MYRSLTLSLALTLAAATQADDMVWRGDFSTGDLSQWDNLIHAQGLSVQDKCTYRGDWAGKVTITGDEEFLWNGREDLNRTEFKYQPDAEYTREGEDTYFGWSFYLPETLTESRHELGYWESDQSWQQIFRFNIVGSTFGFQASRAPEPFWEETDFASAGVWRDVAMHIHWSTDPEKGFVDVWLDGEPKGREYFQTLANAEDPMFVQIGILRNQQPTPETILVDNARHGHSLEAVLADVKPSESVSCP
ncbi:polysaccharide lyase [Marinimicrobium sp. ABcell2]|uniref:polysaccharide lyase n=1 Tax=Marinimicrobium sp. ABcell2 TaxID=3069751 RepID=UPI0027B4F116|nr:polysaccharide lyase [Marinimicrobium sp. ABcell2]MDQ2076462.1 polysaccharide lyase [Marinimicrobium sp. ABcell2]